MSAEGKAARGAPIVGKGSVIRRRHVFYIEGYDPQGVPGYSHLFRRELARFLQLWPLRSTASETETDADGIAARWRIETVGPNWQVCTTYEFLRWDDLITRDIARPMWSLLPRVLVTFAEYLANGTIARLFRADWRFACFFLYPIVTLALVVAIPTGLGLAAARLAQIAALPSALAVLLGLGVAGASYIGMRRLAQKWFAILLAASWLWFRDWAHGKRPDYIARIDTFARRIIERARAADADEIVVFGHSGGGTTLVPVIARALAIDADFARTGPMITAVSLGSSLPLAALHPRSDHVRAAILRVATEPSLVWIEAQARKDIMNFQRFDPVSGVGIDAGPGRCNPLVWNVRFRDMLSPAFYGRLRWNFFRMHYQFIMANDRRAAYDYFMFLCGPVSVRDWATRGGQVLSSFAEDGAYRERALPAMDRLEAT